MTPADLRTIFCDFPNLHLPGFVFSDPLLKVELLVGETEIQPLNPKNTPKKPRNRMAGSHQVLIVAVSEIETHASSLAAPSLPFPASGDFQPGPRHALASLAKTAHP